MNHEVFISYSSKNKQTADAICHVLEQNKIKCWIAPRDISIGEKYGDVIEKAIRSCGVFIIVFSKESSLSSWVESELNIAFTDRRVIMPFRIDQTDLQGEMRLILNNKHWIDAYPKPEIHFSELISSVARQVGSPSSTYNTSFSNDQKTQNPYQAILEICLLYQFVEDFIMDIFHFSTPHNERRRYLLALKRIPDLIKERTNRIKDDQMSNKLNANCNLISKFCSEADYVLPWPGEDRFMRDQSRLKDLKSDLLISSSNVIDYFTKESQLINNEFLNKKGAMYKGGDYVWKILGYETYQMFSEYISPNTIALLKSTDFKQKMIFKDMLSCVTLRENDFYNKGYKPLLYVDTINALIKDDFIEVSNGIFTLNYLGKEFIKNNL